MTFWICRTCAVEHSEQVEVCRICADERQWVPAEGQLWTTLDELAAAGSRLELADLEPDLVGISSVPGAGIGQVAKLVRTPQGNLLWDPNGFIDDNAVRQVRALGEVSAIVASHPHMYGVQVEWSRALGDVPVLVAEATASGWLVRIRRSGPGRGRSRSSPVSPSPSRAATSPAAPWCTGRRAPAAKV